METLTVLTPTRDRFRGCRTSIHAVHVAARKLGVEVEYYEEERRSLIETRNRLLEVVRKAHPNEKSLRLLWLDDDILIPSSDQLAAFIFQAEENNYSLVAPYRTVHPSCQIHASWNVGGKCTCVFSYCHFADKPSMYTLQEIMMLKPFEIIKFSGLGCAYLQMPLDYNFHLAPDGSQIEDVNFFQDNPQIEIRHFPLKLYHLKEAPI